MASQRTLLLLGLFALGALASPPQGRILGGEDVVAGEYPWSASLRVDKTHVGSATIIGQNKLLTAGHLVSKIGTTPLDVSSVAVRVGSINQYAGGTILDVCDIVIHPSYGNFVHDIAVLTLCVDLEFTDKIAAATLPTKAEEPEEGEDAPSTELPNGTPVYVAGWGEQSDGSLAYKQQKSNFNTLSSSNCEYECGFGYEHSLCLTTGANQGICRGDAGSAVLDDNNILVGLASFIFGDCGSDYPNIAVRIYYYLDWINSLL
ncbi:uncharacterized protein Dwil_GK25504 [Drosophila willistoni]|uniref:trypsin n=1 Tax=Drosophila willistoni TaxID=7260 RepID=B4NDT3_DROWI|nr:chymotrypsin-1 [Drosophila willistoni]EDW81902.1 uncharacterized protein Dwil_GK25504 [Drosophila willistoni]